MIGTLGLNDAKWIEMGSWLRTAALDASLKIDALPEDIEPYEEGKLIDAISAEAYAVATLIAASDALSPVSAKVRKMALSWLDGKGCGQEYLI
ncbi:MAG: hypothetical protein DI595_02350 [Agrobacterium fabrum]|uniref:Uncharacterized protein n=1 Tax=Agrobacterium fabrum TaxID=1176649 RepID=A0A2W5FJ72_9HYPH|nr:MAG: hypothetical protein DI595_02350 [Agrobacterium fabrum]